MNDTIIFMSAYKTEISKKKINLLKLKKKSVQTPVLLDKHHLNYIFAGDTLVSPHTSLKIQSTYDYVQQQTTFSYISSKTGTPAKTNELPKDFSRLAQLLHTQSVLCDLMYFKIDFFFSLQPFLISIREKVFQINPIAFSMNHNLIICFEVIDSETGLPLSKDQVCGKADNYNLLCVNEYNFFKEKPISIQATRIPHLIYQMIGNLFSELSDNRFETDSYSFVHNTLVLSNEILYINKYLRKLIGVTELPTPITNISTTPNYIYYPQDGSSIITNYKPEDHNLALYNGIIFESIKLNIYLTQTFTINTIENTNDILKNNLYLENLFFGLTVPIETLNFLSCIHDSTTFQNHQKAIELKLSYSRAKDESKRNKNSVRLNILLYIVSLISAIGSLETLENKLNVPFVYSFPIALVVFVIAGIIWWWTEQKQNKQF